MRAVVSQTLETLGYIQAAVLLRQNDLFCSGIWCWNMKAGGSHMNGHSPVCLKQLYAEKSNVDSYTIYGGIWN